MYIKVKEHIEYRLFSFTYKILTTSQPTYLFKLISVQSPRSTKSSSVITISRPPTSSSLKTTNHSFRRAAPYLSNKLPHSFHEPHSHLGLPILSTSPAVNLGKVAMQLPMVRIELTTQWSQVQHSTTKPVCHLLCVRQIIITLCSIMSICCITAVDKLLNTSVSVWLSSIIRYSWREGSIVHYKMLENVAISLKLSAICSRCHNKCVISRWQ